MGIQANNGNVVTATFADPQEIVISHLDDSIKIGDGTRLAGVTSNNELKVQATFAPSASIDIAEQVLSTRIDEASSTVTYVGKAQPGTSAASAAWQIKKITESGTETIIEFANGTDLFDNVWNNRGSLSYS
jgi:hypothetical protein